MKINQIRQAFLSFFSKHDHEVMMSSSLIPHHDPSLMFTNSGMVQFKNWFTGVEHPRFSRATTAQKCIRAGGKHNDLENVGYTARHHTFFEMLGNFSFGDYFKEEAIYYAWQLITSEFAIPPSHLYITVYSEDDEAYNIWHKLTGFGPDKILRITTSDNFWSMGDTGPCGPCSEIFFDHGPKFAGGLPGTPEQDGDRYVEIWNLVFMQYEQLADKTRIDLPRPSIDTGMGIERIAALLQGVNDNFLTDTFQQIIRASQQLSGNGRDLTSHKVIADHLRSSSFLIADGIIPSNEGRGYVLRRIMRRAMRHINQLGCRQSLLHQLAPILIEEMGLAYPELKRAAQTIISVLKLEEERFGETLDRGIKILKQSIDDISGDKLNTKGGENILKGEVAFKLYDTYGFPLDLTKDILRSHNIILDEIGFETAMEEQKTRARAAWVGSGEHLEAKIWFDLHEKYGSTEFLGYDADTVEAIVIAIITDGKESQKLDSGQDGIVVLNHTPFYGESGGQVGDTGRLIPICTHGMGGDQKLNEAMDSKTEWHNEIKVFDTKIHGHRVFAHYVKIIITAPSLKVGDKVKAEVDINRRNRIRANHSATHLLHRALRIHLGEHVIQKGSLVNAEKLRFDFVHNQSLTQEQIGEIERTANQMIIDNNSSVTRLMAYDDALKEGAMALFGEKYSDDVRVIRLGYSLELCGGTHVKSTGDIGMLKIVSEEAIAAGVRRIEAITGVAALDYCQEYVQQIRRIANTMKCGRNEVEERVSNLIHDRRTMEKELQEIKISNYAKQAQVQKIRKQLEIDDKKIRAGQIGVDNLNSISYDGEVRYLMLQDLDNGSMKQLMDTMRATGDSNYIVLINQVNNQLMLMISMTDGTIHPGANMLLQLATRKFGGKGGGNAELAQAGGINAKPEDMMQFLLNEMRC